MGKLSNKNKYLGIFPPGLSQSQVEKLSGQLRIKLNGTPGAAITAACGYTMRHPGL